MIKELTDKLDREIVFIEDLIKHPIIAQYPALKLLLKQRLNDLSYEDSAILISNLQMVAEENNLAVITATQS